MENSSQKSTSDTETGHGHLRHKPVPIAMAQAPFEYIPGNQEGPVQLTSLADMLQWTHHWARSRSVWPLVRV